MVILLTSYNNFVSKCTAFDTFAAEKYHDFETQVWGHSRSMKMTLFVFDKLHIISCSDSIVTHLELHLTTSELWFGQEQDGILP